MRNIVMTALTLTAVLLLARGFAVSAPRHAPRLTSAGLYWAGGAVCLLPVAFLLSAPTHVIVLNLIALAVAIARWAVDVTWGDQKS